MTIEEDSRKTSQCRIIIARKKHITLFSQRLVRLANRGESLTPIGKRLQPERTRQIILLFRLVLGKRTRTRERANRLMD